MSIMAKTLTSTKTLSANFDMDVDNQGILMRKGTTTASIFR